MSKVPLKFHGVQGRFFNSGPSPCLFMGGVGSGKSYVGILKLLYLLDMYPGSRGVIVRQRFSSLKKTTAATLWKLLPSDRIARRNNNEGTVWLKNGSQLILLHLDKEDSLDNLKSMELNFGYIDQAEDVTAEAFDTLQERLGRWTGATKRGGYPADWPYRTEVGDPIPPAYLFISAYSPGYEHWITSRFWEHGAERERYRKDGYLTLVGSTRDNPNLTKQYIKGRLAMGKEYVERMVDASTWGANEGAIFRLEDHHLLDYSEDLMHRIHTKMRMHRVMDHGEAVPTAVLWYATDSDNNVFFYREYGQAGLLVSEHRQYVQNLSKTDFPGDTEVHYHSNYADPAIFAKSRGRGVNTAPQWAVADEWSDRRIVDGSTSIVWRPANNNESMTINRVREYMRFDRNHLHPLKGEPGSPRVFFVRQSPKHPQGLHETLKDIRAAKRTVVGVNADGTKQFKDDRDDTVRDHWLDCVRYAIGMRPALGMRAGREPMKAGEIRIDDYYKYTEEDQHQKSIEKTRGWQGPKGLGY